MDLHNEMNGEKVMAQSENTAHFADGSRLNLETGEIIPAQEQAANPNGLKTVVNGKLVPMDGYRLDGCGNVIPCEPSPASQDNAAAPLPCAAGGNGGIGNGGDTAACDDPGDNIPSKELPFIPWREGQSFRAIDLEMASFGVDLTLHTGIFQEDAQKKRANIAAALMHLKPEDVDTVAAYIKELEGKLVFFDQEIDDLKLKKEAIRIKAEGLRNLVAFTLERTGRKSCKGNCYQMERRVTEKVEAPKDEEALKELASLDQRLVRKVEKLEADKRSIKAFLSRPGAVLPGCRITKNSHIVLK